MSTEFHESINFQEYTIERIPSVLNRLSVSFPSKTPGSVEMNVLTSCVFFFFQEYVMVHIPSVLSPLSVSFSTKTELWRCDLN